MSRAKRPDRYCTPKNAQFVYQYMLERADKVATLFKIRGVHRTTFKNHLTALSSEAPVDNLYESLHSLCCIWDRSEPDEYSKFKARIRRYLHTKRIDRVIYVSQKTKLALEKFAEKEGLLGADEAIMELIQNWEINTALTPEA